jgi:hypothetical protein
VSQYFSFQDDFSGSSFSANWSNWGGENITVSGGTANITTGSNQWTYVGFECADRYDLTGKAAWIQVVEAGTQQSGYRCYQIDVQKASGESLYWFILNGNAEAWSAEGGGSPTYTKRGEVTHTDGDWYRVREDSGTIYWDHSSDGISWDNVASLANPFAVTSMLTVHYTEIFNTGQSSTVAKLDNYNITPSPPNEETAGIKVYSGSEWLEKPVKVYSGSEWVEKPVKVFDGTSWE